VIDVRRLPRPLVGVWQWQLSGACRDDSEMFFHPQGERGPRCEERDAAAKAVCAGCPVLPQCRAHALATRQAYGVWGGLSEDDRASLSAAEQVDLPAVTSLAVPPGR